MKNWSLNQKIWTIVGGLSFAFVITTLFALKSLTTLRDSMNEITTVIVKRDQLTSEIKDNQRLLSINTLESIIFSTPEQLAANKDRYKQYLDKQEKDIADYRAIASDQGKALMDKYQENYAKFIAEVSKVREFSSQNKNAEASELYIHAREQVVPELRKYVGELNKLTSDVLAASSKAANEEAARALVVSMIIFAISISTSLLVAYFTLKALSQAINTVVKNLSDGALQVTSAATQIASASEELSQAATEQAASLEETAASVEEMNSMIAKNSDNANSASSLSEKSTGASNKGKQVVEQMIQSMSHIDKSNSTIMDQVNDSNQQVAGIVKVIEQIAKKTQVINDIVNKTELLSFNASVEAARAGEHGKGFAVVAEEVGNLARMSGAAAEEISSLIESSVENVNKIVQETSTKVGRLIEEGKKAVAEGTEVAGTCDEVLTEIVGNVSSVSNMSGEIATASQEQSRGIQEISKAMAQLDQMTQQNAATSEECASAAEELSAQAESLKNTVNHLVITVHGVKGAKDVVIQDEPTAAPMVKAKAKNVVHLKPAKAKPAAPAPAMKRAVGDAPSYQDEGFTDV